MRSKLTILVISAAILFTGCTPQQQQVTEVLTSPTPTETKMIKKEPTDAVMEKDEDAENVDGEKMMEKDKDIEDVDGEKMMEKDAGAYTKYNGESLASSTDNKRVLFFAATWCPTCKALNSDIEKNLKEIPGGVTIINVDYDKYTELKKQFGVTYQHTLVQIDKDGKQIKKWSGSPTLEKLIEEI